MTIYNDPEAIETAQKLRQERITKYKDNFLPIDEDSVKMKGYSVESVGEDYEELLQKIVRSQ